MSSQFTTPVVTEMQVIPVAGHDSMLMNLSGAHAPFFTRNIVIIKPRFYVSTSKSIIKALINMHSFEIQL
ncbi:hypothetical protein QU759_22200, partial [Escherichia coli]|nr:hypothetical protein [Escherichia coli]